MIKFHCVHCGTKIKATPDRGGKAVKCPQCSTLIQVPTEKREHAAIAVDVDPTPLSPEQLKAQKSLKYGCLIMMALPVVMSLIMCSGVIRSSKSKEKTVSQPVTPDMAILTMPSGNDIPFTFNQAAYDRLKQLAEDKDAAGFAQLLLSGVAGKTPSGTICHIVSSGPSSYEVLILEGPHIGKSAFVSPLYVKREKF